MIISERAFSVEKASASGAASARKLRNISLTVSGSIAAKMPVSSRTVTPSRCLTSSSVNWL